jgi:hypothetical protein
LPQFFAGLSKPFDRPLLCVSNITEFGLAGKTVTNITKAGWRFSGGVEWDQTTKTAE